MRTHNNIADTHAMHGGVVNKYRDSAACYCHGPCGSQRPEIHKRSYYRNTIRGQHYTSYTRGMRSAALQVFGETMYTRTGPRAVYRPRAAAELQDIDAHSIDLT